MSVEITKQQTLSQKAYAMIKNNLQNGVYRGYINGRQVARELDIGFTPVREAFLRLQNEGLIQRVDNVGYFVNQVDLKGLMSIFQVRECIEMYVWEQAFDLITEEDVQRMEEIHERECQYFREGKTREYVQMDIALHSVLLERFGNEDLTALYRNVRERNLICPVKTAKKDSEAAMEEHREWIRCVTSGDREKTLECIRQHTNNTKMRMKEGYIAFYA